jgi:chromosome segregation ATPase
VKPATVYTRTSKGVLAVKNKTVRLTRERRAVFLAIDGKTSVAELQARTGIAAAEISEAIKGLEDDGYVKVFAQAAEESPGDPPDDGADELDFTRPGPGAARESTNPDVVDFRKRAALRREAVKRALQEEAAAAAAAAGMQQVEGQRMAVGSRSASALADVSVGYAEPAEHADVALGADAHAALHVQEQQRTAARATQQANSDLVARCARLETQLKTAVEAFERAKEIARRHAERHSEIQAQLEKERGERAEAEAKTVAAERARDEAEGKVAAAESERDAAQAQCAAADRAREEADAKGIAAENARLEAEARALATERAREELQQALADATRALSESRSGCEQRASERAQAEAKAAAAQLRVSAAEAALQQAQEAAYRHAENHAELEVRIETERRGREEAEAKLRAERHAREHAALALLRIKNTIGFWQELSPDDPAGSHK